VNSIFLIYTSEWQGWKILKLHKQKKPMLSNFNWNVTYSNNSQNLNIDSFPVQNSIDVVLLVFKECCFQFRFSASNDVKQVKPPWQFPFSYHKIKKKLLLHIALLLLWCNSCSQHIEMHIVLELVKTTWNWKIA